LTAAGNRYLRFCPNVWIKRYIGSQPVLPVSSAYYPAIAGKMPRHDFLKLMAASGVVMTFAPFVDWGKFLPNKSTSVADEVKIG
jgi:hypothetical protein